MFYCIDLWLEFQADNRADPTISSAMTSLWDVIANGTPDNTRNGEMRLFHLSSVFGDCSSWLSKNYF